MLIEKYRWSLYTRERGGEIYKRKSLIKNIDTIFFRIDRF